MRIEKVSQTTPTSAQIVDGYSTSTTDGYSANYVNNYVDGLHTYSTTETIVGTWIDNKPIYRKVISFTSTTSPYQYTHNISSIDKIVNFYGYHIRAGDPTTFRPLQAYNTSYPSYYASVDSISKTTVEVFAGDSVKSSLTWYIVIEYTKTTD